MFIRKIAIVSLVVSLISVTVAQPVERGIYFSQSAGLSVNPLGIIFDTRAFFRLPVVSREGMLWESTRIDLGLRNELTPTDDHLAIFATIIPISFFELTIKGGPYLVYDLLGFGYTELSDGDRAYDSDAIDTLGRSTRLGYWISINPVLKLKVASIIAIHSFNLDIYDMGDYEKFFLERRTYSLRKSQDIDYVNDTYLLYEISSKIMVGCTYRILQVPSYAFSSQRVCAMLVLNTSLINIDRVYSVVMAGIYPEDRVLKLKPYIALKAGFDLKVR